MKFVGVFAFIFLAVLAFASADIRVAASDAEAEANCMCPRILEPVCGSDDQTYPNSCEFLCVQKKMARKGRSIALAHAGSC